VLYWGEKQGGPENSGQAIKLKGYIGESGESTVSVPCRQDGTTAPGLRGLRSPP